MLSHAHRCAGNAAQDPAGIARIQMAKESKARFAAKKKALAMQNANSMKVIANTKAAEDDDIMGARAAHLRASPSPVHRP